MHSTSVQLINRSPNYITPYLSDAAKEGVRNWERNHKMPVFAFAFDHATGNACKNCNGIGGVYLHFIKAGPYSSPSIAKSVVTWFDGDGVYGKGWYVVGETMAFPCPECEKNAKVV